MRAGGGGDRRRPAVPRQRESKRLAAPWLRLDWQSPGHLGTNSTLIGRSIGPSGRVLAHAGAHQSYRQHRVSEADTAARRALGCQAPTARSISLTQSCSAAKAPQRWPRQSTARAKHRAHSTSNHGTPEVRRPCVASCTVICSNRRSARNLQTCRRRARCDRPRRPPSSSGGSSRRSTAHMKPQTAAVLHAPSSGPARRFDTPLCCACCACCAGRCPCRAGTGQCVSRSARHGSLRARLRSLSAMSSMRRCCAGESRTLSTPASRQPLELKTFSGLTGAVAPHIQPSSARAPSRHGCRYANGCDRGNPVRGANSAQKKHACRGSFRAFAPIDGSLGPVPRRQSRLWLPEASCTRPASEMGAAFPVPTARGGQRP